MYIDKIKSYSSKGKQTKYHTITSLSAVCKDVEQCTPSHPCQSVRLDQSEMTSRRHTAGHTLFVVSTPYGY